MQIPLTDTTATLDDKRWQEQADQLSKQSLPQVQSKATAWALTIGTLTGLFGLTLVVKGRADLAVLEPVTAAAFGALALIAITFAIWAIYLGALAAQGMPVWKWSSGPDLKQTLFQQADKAKSRLKWSRVLILISLIFLIASIAVDWYGPGTGAPQLFVVTKSIGVVCGELTSSGETMEIQPSNGRPVVRVHAADVLSATLVPRCP